MHLKVSSTEKRNWKRATLSSTTAFFLFIGSFLETSPGTAPVSPSPQSPCNIE